MIELIYRILYIVYKIQGNKRKIVMYTISNGGKGLKINKPYDIIRETYA